MFSECFTISPFFEDVNIKRLKQFYSGRLPLFFYPSLDRPLIITFPWDITGLSLAYLSSVPSRLRQCSMGQAASQCRRVSLIALMMVLSLDSVNDRSLRSDFRRARIIRDLQSLGVNGRCVQETRLSNHHRESILPNGNLRGLWLEISR